jgi:lipopolysaccharide/colanic/teichoic acid biosynthesis glycosyltransferase
MLKRVIDVSVSIFLLLSLLPLFIILGILIRLFLGSPVIFSQSRPGLNGVPFKLIKFRTMAYCVDNKGHLLPDEARLTQFGKLLRATSLDELPELWNVLKGEMSLVGPRPLLLDYLPLYSEEQQRRHEVRPGITGLAQVNGRNALSWEEKFKYDVWYVQNQSFWLDVKILFLTVIKVVKRDGIQGEKSVTAEQFMGNPASR